MSRTTFYYHLKQFKQSDKYADNVNRLSTSIIYHINRGRYGYRRITMDLHNQGIVINHKTIERLMRKCEVRKRYRSHRGQTTELLLTSYSETLKQRNLIKNE